MKMNQAELGRGVPDGLIAVEQAGNLLLEQWE